MNTQTVFESRYKYYSLHHDSKFLILTNVILLMISSWIRQRINFFRNMFSSSMVRRARRMNMQVFMDDCGVYFVTAMAKEEFGAGGIANHVNTDLPKGIYGIVCNWSPKSGSYVRVQLSSLGESERIKQYEPTWQN